MVRVIFKAALMQCVHYLLANIVGLKWDFVVQIINIRYTP